MTVTAKSLDRLISSHPSRRRCPDFGWESAGQRGKRRWSVTSWVASPQRRRRFWTRFWSRAWTSSSLSCPSKTPSRSPSLPPHQQGADTLHRIGRRGSAQPLPLRSLLLLRAEVSELKQKEKTRNFIENAFVLWCEWQETHIFPERDNDSKWSEKEEIQEPVISSKLMDASSWSSAAPNSLWISKRLIKWQEVGRPNSIIRGLLPFVWLLWQIYL